MNQGFTYYKVFPHTLFEQKRRIYHTRGPAEGSALEDGQSNVGMKKIVSAVGKISQVAAVVAAVLAGDPSQARAEGRVADFCFSDACMSFHDPRTYCPVTLHPGDELHTSGAFESYNGDIHTTNLVCMDSPVQPGVVKFEELKPINPTSKLQINTDYSKIDTLTLSQLFSLFDILPEPARNHIKHYIIMVVDDDKILYNDEMDTVHVHRDLHAWNALWINPKKMSLQSFYAGIFDLLNDINRNANKIGERKARKEGKDRNFYDRFEVFARVLNKGKATNDHIATKDVPKWQADVVGKLMDPRTNKEYREHLKNADEGTLRAVEILTGSTFNQSTGSFENSPPKQNDQSFYGQMRSHYFAGLGGMDVNIWNNGVIVKKEQNSESEKKPIDWGF